MERINIKNNGNKNGDENFIEYIFENINFSFVNALRRTIISDIPVHAFNGFPNLLRKKKKGDGKKVENIIIEKNTTRLNNEIIKQRLTCIPIYLPVTSSNNYLNLEFKLNTNEIEFEENIIPTVKYITTEHFKIFENDQEKKIEEGGFNPLKPFETEDGKKHYILIIRLNPEISKQIPAEELILNCKLSKHTAKENACFNVVSCCSYSYYPDEKKQKEKWEEYVRKNDKSEQPVKITKKDEINWYLLNGKRFYVKDRFKFIIESLGIYSCDDLIIKAAGIIINKLENFKDGIINPIDMNYKFICNKSLINVSYAYDITLTNEDYTIGKVLEYILHKNMDIYNISYVGFIKKHPHDTDSIIRIILNLESADGEIKKKIKKQKEIVKDIFTQVYLECIKLFKQCLTID